MFRNRSHVYIFLVSFFLLSSFNKKDYPIHPNKKFVVVLDAGHGGHDPGNLGNGYLEKDIALAIVKRVGIQLSKNKDVKVVYTREDDTFIGLKQRGVIANKAKADLFVSIHCNSHKSDAYGTETFVLGLHANEQNFEVAKKENSVIYLEDNYEATYEGYDINSPESVIGVTIMQEEFLEQSLNVAGLIQSAFKSKLKRKDRGPKQAGFIVLHQTFMPSILIEVGFLTNKSEGAYLNSKKGQEEISNTIAEAIIDYKNGVEAGSVKLNKQPEEIEPEIVEDKIIEEKVEEALPKAEEPVVETVVPEGNPITISNEGSTKEDQMEVVDDQPQNPVNNPQVDIPAKEVTQPAEKVDKSGHGVTFKVQILATTEVIPLDGKFFKGLDTLSKEPYNSLYRYMYGNADTHEKAKLLKSDADSKGYTDSYIVSYKDGERIPLWKALKLVSNQ